MMTQLFNISLLIACPQPQQPLVAPKPVPQPALTRSILKEERPIPLSSPPGLLFDGVDFNDLAIQRIRSIA